MSRFVQVARIATITAGGVVGLAIAHWVRVARAEDRATVLDPLGTEREAMVQEFEGWISVFGLLGGLLLGAVLAAIICKSRSQERLAVRPATEKLEAHP